MSSRAGLNGLTSGIWPAVCRLETSCSMPSPHLLP